MENTTSATATIPTRLLRRLSVHNDKAEDLLQAASASTPQLSMRRMSPGSSPTKRQLKNYDMKELENRNGGLGWVGPIYGNKAHSSRRYVSPSHDDNTEAIKRKSAAHSGRRGSAAMLQELYPTGVPAPSTGTNRRAAHRPGSSGSPDHHHQRGIRSSQKTGRGAAKHRGGKRAPRDGGGGSGGRAGAESLIMEQKKLLRLLQESIRAEEESVTRRGSKKHTASNRDFVQPKKERRSLGGGDHKHTRRDAPHWRHEFEFDHTNHENKRYSFPGSEPNLRPTVSQRDTDSSDTSSSDSAVDSDSSSSSSDHLRNDDESMSSLDSRDSYGDEAFMSHHKSRQDVERAHDNQYHRGRDRRSKHSTNRVHHEEIESGRNRSHRGLKGRGHTTTAQVRYTSPNQSSTVAAARAGISHNFFELYGGRPGGVRVPEKVKISSMVEKATPIRNSADQNSTRRRLASPTVSSGRRFHTPELDRVHNRRSVSADSYRESGSGLTDAAEWSRLTDWLGRLKLQKYAGLFRRSGITKLSLVELLRGHDLAEIGIDLNDHPRILQSIQDFSHRTISFAEEALSPHEERLPHNGRHVERKAVGDRSKSIETRRYGQNHSDRTPEHDHYITSKDVLTGDRRTGGAYRPLSLEDLLKLGSPERHATKTLSQSDRLSSRVQNHAQTRLSQSQDTKAKTPSPTQVRLARSGGEIAVNRSIPRQAPVKTGISAVFSSTPPSSSKNIPPKAPSPSPIVESTLLSLNKSFWVGDESLFYKIWDTVVGDLHNRNESTTAVVQASHLLELFSRVYFVTWPQRAQIRGLGGGVSDARARFRCYVDKILAEPDKYSGLLKSREFATFVGIGMLPDAASNAAYASLFKPEWADGLAKRLNSFLSNVMSAAAPLSSQAPEIGEDVQFISSSDVILGGEGSAAVNPPGPKILNSGVVLGSPCGVVSDNGSDEDSVVCDEKVSFVVPRESLYNQSAENSVVHDNMRTAGVENVNERVENVDAAMSRRDDDEGNPLESVDSEDGVHDIPAVTEEQDNIIKSDLPVENHQHSTSLPESSCNKDIIVEETQEVDVIVDGCAGKIDDKCNEPIGALVEQVDVNVESPELPEEVEVPPQGARDASFDDVKVPVRDQYESNQMEENNSSPFSNESAGNKIVDKEGVDEECAPDDVNEQEGDNVSSPVKSPEDLESKSANENIEALPKDDIVVTDAEKNSSDTFESDVVIGPSNIVTNGGGGKKKKRKSKAR